MNVICKSEKGFCAVTQKEETFDLTIGKPYKVVREFEADGKLFYELELNDCGEPCCEYEQSMFIKEIEYDVPFEVTKEQFNFLMNNFQMVVAGQTPEDNPEGKYMIKVWLMKYIKLIEFYLITGELPK